MTKRYSTIFIDLDDTLWDTQSNNKEALREIYDKRGWENHFPSFQHFHDIYLPINNHLWDLYAQGKISKPELIRRRITEPLATAIHVDEATATAINDELLAYTSAKTKLIDGAKELSEYLHSKYQLVIVSNGFEEVQYKKMRGAGIESYFQHVVLSDQVGTNKPHPEIFSVALQKANAQPDEVLMIGDSWTSDIVGAKNSGIDQMWFNPHGASLGEFSPTYVIKHLLDICRII